MCGGAGGGGGGWVGVSIETATVCLTRDEEEESGEKRLSPLQTSIHTQSVQAGWTRQAHSLLTKDLIQFPGEN